MIPMIRGILKKYLIIMLERIKHMSKKLTQVFICFVLVESCFCSIVFGQGEVNNGEIKAKILNVEDGTPITGERFILMPIKYENGEMLATVTFDHESTSDSEGRIHFENIKPGTYAISCTALCNPVEDKIGNLNTKVK